MGLAPLASAKLELLLDGQIAQTINWSGNLAGYETQIVPFSEITIDKNAELKIQVSEPNGLADAEPANNQLVENFTVSPAVETAVLDLEIQFDAFPISNYWELADANGQILYFGGNPRAKSANQPIVKEYNTANALVHHTLGLPANGCYQFSFYDIIGDGICCEEGNGSYTIQSAFFTQVDSDGNYGDGETREFCIDGVGVAEMADNASARIWPNPTTGTVNVEWPEAESPFIQWSLLDLTGRLVDAGRIGTAANTATVALTDVPEGSYLVQLTSGNRRASLRLHIAR